MNLGEIEFYSYRSIDYVPLGCFKSMRLVGGINIHKGYLRFE